MHLYRMQLPAKSLGSHWTQSGRSFIKTRNNSGHKRKLFLGPLKTSNTEQLSCELNVFCVLTLTESKAKIWGQ